MPTNTGGGGNSLSTMLLAVLVIAVVAFGVWYVMNDAQEDESAQDAGLQINLGSSNPEQ